MDTALLAAVQAAPADDAPRLVIADWLQERGHAWGELDVSRTSMTERGARALLDSTTLPSTLRLRVSREEAGTEVDALRERFAVVIVR